MLKKIILLFLLLVVGFSLYLVSRSEPLDPQPLTGENGNAAEFIGRAASAKPLSFTVPAHPYLATQGRNTMHADGYSSDVHPYQGPLGINLQRNTRAGLTTIPGGQCATLTISEQQNIVVLCAGLTGFRIHLLKHRSLKLLAEYKLPIRPSTYDSIIHRDKRYVMEDSSGAYFYLDNEDRLVIAASDQSIRRVAHTQQADGSWTFHEHDRWDLSSHVPHTCTSALNWEPDGECDPITAVLPDHQGLIWFVSRYGRYGTLNPVTGDIHSAQLHNEEVQNGFSVASDGVYVVSDHALYRFNASTNGEPLIVWREAYDRGSGTTPTLMGERYITVADNADKQINLLVYARQEANSEERQLCKIPLFNKEHSATENSMIALGRSIIIENNAGYINAYEDTDWQTAAGGIMRIDIRADESGCDVIWQSSERVTSVVPKLSAKNGLVYVYTFDLQDNKQVAWYLTAVDFETGETQYKALTGIGSTFDNNWSPISLTQDGTAYVGTAKGLVAIWDGETPTL